MVIDGSWISSTLEHFLVTTTGTAANVYGKYENGTFRFYGAFYTSTNDTVLTCDYPYLLIY